MSLFARRPAPPPADVARSRPAETRRETGVTTARARAAVPPPVPPASPQTREPSAGEKTQRSMAEPSAGQVAALMAGAREGDIGELTRLVRRRGFSPLAGRGGLNPPLN